MLWFKKYHNIHNTNKSVWKCDIFDRLSKVMALWIIYI